jgi:glutathione synthase/RimK-type ligase-like ATP-grasp enzyme
LKKVLIVTNEDDPHADEVINKLGEKVFRLNTEKILEDFSIHAYLNSNSEHDIYLKSFGRTIALSEVSSVYYRRPIKPESELFKYEESQKDEAWGALYHFLYGLENVPWMGHPLEDKRKSSRILQLRNAVKVGFNIPPTFISRDSVLIKDFVLSNNKVAVKPIHVRGVQHDKKWTPYFTEVINARDFSDISNDIIGSTYNYIQEYIDKKREWRVTIVGNEIFPCVIESQNSDGGEEDWRKINYNSIPHYFEQIPDAVRVKILNYCKAVELNFGAMDLIETPNGEWYFLECNPNGQWLWIEELTNQPISAAIANWHSKFL